MPRDYYPRREVAIVDWTSNFRRRIESDPHLYNVSPSQIAEYAIVQQRFVDVFAAANSPTGRTPSIITAKNDARIALEAATRSLAAWIGALQSTTVVMRTSLGLATGKRGGYRRAFSPPEQPPRLSVRSMQGVIATIVLSDREGEKRRKPRGAAGAIVWSHVGEFPPAHRDDWTLTGQTTRTLFRIAFDGSIAPGTKVWLAACWMTPCGKESKWCEPVYTHVGYGLAMLHESIKAAGMLYVAAGKKPKRANRESTTLALAA